MSESENQNQLSKIAELEKEVSELTDKLKKSTMSYGMGKGDPFQDNYYQHMVDYVVPKAKVVRDENLAVKALIVSGHISGKNELFNEDPVNMENYSYHNPSSSTDYTLIQLDLIYMINQIKMHLLDVDQRCYNYTVDVSHDEKIWVRVCDHWNDKRTSHQVIDFQSLPVKYIKITGRRSSTSSSSNNFEILKFRCGLF